MPRKAIVAHRSVAGYAAAQAMRELVIDGTRITDDGDCYVIAEIGHNHQGSVEKASELIRSPQECGVDAVKLQKRDNRDALHPRAMYDAPYDHENSFGATYGAHREALELDRDGYIELQHIARELGVTLFATAFDAPSADFLAELEMPAFKIASGDLTNTPLLRHVASFGKPIFLSTGGATIEDVERAVDDDLPINPQLCVLQCTAAYPADAEELNLGVITTFRERYPDFVIGLSDHQDGIAMALVALHARRASDGEALHAQPHLEGHRPCVLAHAGGDAQARSRPSAHPGRARRRRQEGRFRPRRARSQDGQDARRRARSRRRVACSGQTTSRRSRRRRRPAALRARALLGRELRRALREDEAITFDDLAT